MTTKKLSELPLAGTYNGSEYLLGMQNGLSTKFPLGTMGDLTAAGSIYSGRSVCGNTSGSVAMTINDGYGNANIAFNHVAGVPDNTSVGAGLGSSARITANVDSATGYLAFSVGDAVTAGTAVGLSSQLIISTAGVTMPYQPAFRAYAGTTINYTTANTKIIAHNLTIYNIGGHYSTTNFRFTAPVAGVYVFTARCWAVAGSTTATGIQFLYNGVTVVGVSRVPSSSGEYTTLELTTQVQLAANDYIELFTEYCSATGIVHTSQGEGYSIFSGFLLR